MKVDYKSIEYALNKIPMSGNKSYKENFWGSYHYYRLHCNIALYKLSDIREYILCVSANIATNFHSNYRCRSRFVAPGLQYKLRERYAGELLILLVNITVSVACE